MSHLYRPTVHQLVVLDSWLLDLPTALREVEAGLDRLAPQLGNSDIAELKALLDRVRCQWSFDDERRPAIRSRNFHLTTGEPRLRGRLRAYQEAGAVLLHTVWLWDGQGVNTHSTIRKKCPTRRGS